MEKKGFVTRTADAKDLRRTQVGVTEPCKATATAYYQLVNNEICRVLDRLSAEDGATYVHSLGIIAQHTIEDYKAKQTTDSQSEEEPTCGTC